MTAEERWQLLHEIAQLVVKLDMVSQVHAKDLAPAARDSSNSLGGDRPPGGIDRKDDRESDYPQKSADHFRTRLRGARGDRTLIAIRDDAAVALVAWQKTPLTGEPEYGSPQWKRWVAASELSSADIARKFNVTKRYINMVRVSYGAKI